MKTVLTILVLLSVLFSLGADSDKPNGVFSSLHIGQKVNLKEEEQGFTITVIGGDLPLSHKVLEIDNDFVVLESVAGVEVSIPVYSVRSLVRMRMK